MSHSQSGQSGKTAQRAVPTNLSSTHGSRRLAVVLAAQVSEVTAKDQLRWQLIEPSLTENRGRLIRWTGCKLLAVFDLPDDAVRCAIVLRNLSQSQGWQPHISPANTFRFGVELGEVLVEFSSVSGEAVTVAEQLAASARANEVYISGSVHAQVSNRLACSYRDLGESTLDSIAHPVRVYGVSPLPVLGETRVRIARWVRVSARARLVSLVERARLVPTVGAACVVGVAMLCGPWLIGHAGISATETAASVQTREWTDPKPLKAKAAPATTRSSKAKAASSGSIPGPSRSKKPTHTLEVPVEG